MAAGMGVALVAAPAIASADDGAESSASESAKPTATHRASAPGRHPGSRAASRSSAARSSGPARSAGAVRRGVAAPTRTSAPIASPSVSVTARTTASAVSTDPLGNAAAFLGLPGAPATSAPSLGAVPLLLRLTLEDVFTGTGPTPVTNPTAVVTGLFNQVLREAPTTDEIQNYLGVLALTGVNGVVAGLYSSSQFRQQEVANYYLELLSRPATQQEISWGASELMWGTPEPLFAASIASTSEFYAASAAGGLPDGPTPSAGSYVNLLYRTMLGQPADANAAAIYVQRLQAGQGTGLTALQFVTADSFRAVKVGEIYSVLGQTGSAADIAGYVGNWFLNGGLVGIATGLLAGATNVQNIEAGQVVLPDMATAAKLQSLLLSPYIDGPTGFTQQYLSLVGDCGDTSSAACKDPALYNLLNTGGATRGIPNISMQVRGITATLANLIPTQNEINLESSLGFPLTNASTLATYFKGGLIAPFSGPVLTADGGTYIVDGHHRWSAIYLINPNAQVTAIDIGYVPRPQDALMQTQIGIGAQNGTLTESQAGTPNVYTVGRTEFDDFVSRKILAGDPDITDPVAHAAAITAVFDTFGNNLGYKGNLAAWNALGQAEQLNIIESYLWDNVVRMRDYNYFVDGAPSRAVMPQVDPLQPTLQYMQDGTLSYTFPIISYLG